MRNLMLIKNREHIISNKQLKKIIHKLGAEFQPAVLVVCENRKELLEYFVAVPYLISSLLDISLWMGKTEGFYLERGDIVVIFTYSQTDDGDDLHSHQLYSIHALLHELYHRSVSDQQLQLSDRQEECEADRFATKFINKKSRFISKVMNWEDEWSMWEEE